MEDIVERLNYAAGASPDLEIRKTCHAAMLEIEQLRLKVADYEAAYGGVAVTKTRIVEP
jgi:hypothetical protein